LKGAGKNKATWIGKECVKSRGQNKPSKDGTMGGGSPESGRANCKNKLKSVPSNRKRYGKEVILGQEGLPSKIRKLQNLWFFIEPWKGHTSQNNGPNSGEKAGTHIRQNSIFFEETKGEEKGGEDRKINRAKYARPKKIQKALSPPGQTQKFI